MIPKVSILIPVYKVELFIERCARSLFEQTFEELEYIFVDDCTPDKSIEILKQVLLEYPMRKNRVRIVHNKKNEGIAQVRNILLNLALGEYLYFVDSDDWIEKSAIELFYKKAIETNADIVISSFFDVREQKCVQTKIIDSSYEGLIGMLSMDIKPVLWLLFVKRELYLNNHISFVSHIDIGEDYIACVKLLYYAGIVECLNQPLYYYNCRQNGNNYSSNLTKYLIDTGSAIKEVHSFINSKGGDTVLIGALRKRMFIFKSKFIFELSKPDYNRYYSYFPEVIRLWRIYENRRFYRLLYWLLEKKYLHTVSYIMIAKSVLKLFRNGFISKINVFHNFREFREKIFRVFCMRK